MRIGHLIKKRIHEGRFDQMRRDPKDGLDKVLIPTREELLRPDKPANRESIAKKAKVAEDLDIADLWENLIGSKHSTCATDQDWQNTVELFESAAMAETMNRRSDRFKLEEAEVAANAFVLLTQAKLFTTMRAAYDLTPAVYPALFGDFNSPYESFDHHIPSEAPEVNWVGEGGEYTEAPIGDRYCKTKANKFGRRISLTRELVLTDRTGLVAEQAAALGESAKYREDELAAKAFQDTSNAGVGNLPVAEADSGAYYPEGTQKALYRTAAVAGDFGTKYQRRINKVSSNAMSQWDTFQAPLKLLRQMDNANGQYINVQSEVLKVVVPQHLEQRAKLALAKSALVDTDDNVAAASERRQFRTAGGLYENFGVKSWEVIPWRLLTEDGTPDNSTWYVAGASQKQFRRHIRWEVEFNRASSGQLGGDDFKKDIVMGVRAGFNTGFRAVDDAYVIQCTS